MLLSEITVISGENPSHPFHELLEELRRCGFSISADDHIRLIRALIDGRSQFGPEQLKFRLCPLLARTAEEQHMFYRVFDAYFPTFAAKPSLAAPPIREQETVLRATRHWTRYVWLILFAVLLWVALLVILGRQSRQQATPTAPAREPTTRQRQIQEPHNVGGEGESQAWARSITLYFFLWVFFGLSIRRILALQHVLRIKDRGDSFSPPGIWPLSVPRTDTPHFIINMARGSARTLRRRTVSASDMLDIERTIRDTVQSLGYLLPVFVKGTQVPEYVMLIETISSADHLSKFYKELSDCLRAEGLRVTCYLFIASSPECTVLHKGEAWAIETIRRRHDDARLIVVTEGEFLIDKGTGQLSPRAAEFKRWSHCVVLTPKFESEWSESERFLRRKFPLFEASKEGLHAVADFFAGDSSCRHSRRSAGVSQKQRSSPPSLDLGIEDIQALLGARLFRMCCACALYPNLQWELTLAIIRMLDPALLEDLAITRLFRIPWYRTGVIPMQTQSALMQHLTDEDRKLVRSVLITYLRSTSPPAKSLAFARGTIEMTVQIWDLDPDDREYIKQRPSLWLRLQWINRNSVLSRIPRQIRRTAFIAGVPALGIKGGSSWLLAIPWVVLAARFVPLWVAIAVGSASTLMIAFDETRKILDHRRLQESISTPLWHLSHEMISATSCTQPSPVTSIAIVPGGRAIISGGYDGGLRLWQAATGKRLETYHIADKAISSIATSLSQRMIVVGSRDGDIQVWRMAMGADGTSHAHEFVNQFRLPGVTAVSITWDGALVAASSADGNSGIWSILTGNQIDQFQYGPGIHGLVFSRDMKTLFVGGYDGLIMEKSIGENKLGQFVDFRAGRISSLTGSTDGRLIAAGTFAGSICIWQLNSKKQRLAFRGHQAAISAIKFQSESEVIVSASVDGTVKGWNTFTGQELFRLSHPAPVTAMDTVGFDNLICTGCTDGTIRIWELSEGRPGVSMDSVLGWSKQPAPQI
jgi:WD40 repeat protein